MVRHVGDKQPHRTRAYHAPRRTAAAEETRRAILRAARDDFESRGWAATTMRSIAAGAGVSPKTVEALFATKPALLEATLLRAFGGDAATVEPGDLAFLRPEAVLELRPDDRRAIEQAPDAASMLKLHAALACEISARAGRICWAVEAAVPSDDRLAAIWARLAEAQRYGARWSAEVLLEKPGVRADLTRREAEEAFLIVVDWSVTRTLTTTGDMSPEEVQAWVVRYYRRMLLAT